MSAPADTVVDSAPARRAPARVGPLPRHHRRRRQRRREKRDFLGVVGYRAALLSALVLPASAIQLAGIPLADFPLGVAFAALAIAALRRTVRVPSGMILGAALIALSGLLTGVAPPSTFYMSSRFQPSSVYVLLSALGLTPRSASNLFSVVKYELALLLVPAVCLLATTLHREFPLRAARCWVAGLTLSCAVAVSDGLGLSTVSLHLIGYVDVGGRQSGLTPQPNHIGLQAAMAAPVLLLHLLRGRGRARMVAVGALLVCLAGLVFAGSRGAAVAVVLALVLTVGLSPAIRRSGLLLGFVLLCGLVLFLLTPAGSGLLTRVRINNGGTAVATSDLDRASLRHQALLDFGHSPIHGIGWGFANDAHVIYLQVLAAGGLLGMLGFLVYLGTVLSGTRAVRYRDPLAGALMAVVLTWLAEGAVENLLTDQWLYLPAGLLVAVVAQSRPVRVRRPSRPAYAFAPRPGVLARVRAAVPLPGASRPSRPVRPVARRPEVPAPSAVKQPVGVALGAPARRRAAVTVLDQAVYGVTNFALAVVVAHYTAPHAYGAFAVVLAAYLVGAGLSRGLCGEVLILRFDEHGRGVWAQVALRLVVRALVTGVLFGLTLTAVQLAFFPSESDGVVLAFAVTSVIAFAQDAARYAAFACGLPGVALRNDLTCLMVQVLATGAVVAAGRHTPEWLVLAWGVGAASGLLVGLAGLGVRSPRWRPRPPDWPWPDGLGLRLGADNVIAQLTQQGTTFVVAGLGAITGAAHLRVAQTLFGPAIVVVLGFQAAFTRELVRRRRTAYETVRAAARRGGLVMGALVAGVAVVALAVPDALGGALFGRSWDGARTLVALFAVGAVAGAAAAAAIAGLRALEDATTTLQVRLASLVVTLGMVTAGGATLGIHGAVGGLSLASALSATYWWWQFERSWRSRRPDDDQGVAGIAAPLDSRESSPDGADSLPVVEVPLGAPPL